MDQVYFVGNCHKVLFTYIVISTWLLYVCLDQCVHVGLSDIKKMFAKIAATHPFCQENISLQCNFKIRFFLLFSSSKVIRIFWQKDSFLQTTSLFYIFIDSLLYLTNANCYICSICTIIVPIDDYQLQNKRKIYFRPWLRSRAFWATDSVPTNRAVILSLFHP